MRLGVGMEAGGHGFGMTERAYICEGMHVCWACAYENLSNVMALPEEKKE